MQQFRLVLLDEYDHVIEVEYESPVFDGDDKFDKEFSDAKYEHLLKLDREYNLLDYDRVPAMEYQRRFTDYKGKWGEWKYYSDPVEDYYNL